MKFVKNNKELGDSNAESRKEDRMTHPMIPRVTIPF